MKKLSRFGLVVLLFIPVSTPAIAVENGQSASGNGVVVDIEIKYNSTQSVSCSGALLSSLVVVTAGHCLLDQSGAISTGIYVSAPGVNVSGYKNWIKVKKVYLPEEYEGDRLGGFVNNSDLGFLLLTSEMQVSTSVTLASEKLLLSLKSSGAKLRVLGYGNTSDAGSISDLPNYYDGSFSPQTMSDANQGSVSSQTGNICKGDSGGPVLYITPTKVVLVGVLTGAQLSVNCSKKLSDGKYYGTFTIINRFANLASQALTDATLLISELRQAKIDEVQTTLDGANSELSDLLEKSSAFETEIEQLKAEISKYKASGLKLITCTKGSSEKIVAGLSPKCPAGYKVRK
jgi:secreted trypsin-like serine protease